VRDRSPCRGEPIPHPHGSNGCGSLRGVTADAIKGSDDHWRRVYAEGAAVPDQDEHVACAEAVFDQALTNGLLAIVATNWPSKIRRSNGDLRSASELLAVINSKLTLQDDIAHVPTEERATELAEDSTLRTLDTSEVFSPGIRAR
jgi:hypothetical protein